MIDFNDKNIMSHQNTLNIRISIHEKSKFIVIRDVFFVFDFSFNLFLIKIFERKNLRIIFDEKNCQIIRKKIEQIIAIETNLIAIDFYKFVFINDIFFDIYFIVYHVVVSKFIVFLFFVFVNSNIFDENFSISLKKIDIIVIHKRFEHLFEKHLKRFSKIFKKLRFTRTFQFCEKYVFVKQIKRNFIIKSKRYKTRCNRIHMNFSDFHSISIKKNVIFFCL